jgi:hypothetical protein
MVLVLLLVTTGEASPRMLFGRVRSRASEASTSNGRHPSVAEATTASQVGKGQGDRPPDPGRVDRDAWRPAGFPWPLRKPAGSGLRRRTQAGPAGIAMPRAGRGQSRCLMNVLS